MLYLEILLILKLLQCKTCFILACFNHYLHRIVNRDGLPGVLGNSGTKKKYRREEGNTNLF